MRKHQAGGTQSRTFYTPYVKNLTTEQIANIYTLRWDIEKFFAW
ncbi:MAG: transposase [Desulfobacterales bacterium]|uniref:Transposase n=1 Tax=Candidatus Desulfaltia bathyphila TaxID=2841697 RepID=A0A8J6N606_9BACT|nr:transposase [Candidatus Desulfaltia bathyphila]MBL7195730.1 transposase [Desulfobacterales bacterium]MBL7207008.1 transposase [Desulfobacterales bacterium]